MKRFHVFLTSVALLFGAAAAASANPIMVNPPGGPWYDFHFGAVGVDAVDGTLSVGSGAGDSIDAPTPPWTFSGPATLIVTDAFLAGDQFEIFDFGASVGLTSVPSGGVFGGTDPTDPNQTSIDAVFSSGTFLFGAGAHSVTIRPVASPFGGGGAFFRLNNAGGEVPEPTSLVTCSLLGLITAGYSWRRKRRAKA